MARKLRLAFLNDILEDTSLTKKSSLLTSSVKMTVLKLERFKERLSPHVVGKTCLNCGQELVNGKSARYRLKQLVKPPRHGLYGVKVPPRALNMIIRQCLFCKKIHRQPLTKISFKRQLLREKMKNKSKANLSKSKENVDSTKQLAKSLIGNMGLLNVELFQNKMKEEQKKSFPTVKDEIETLLVDSAIATPNTNFKDTISSDSFQTHKKLQTSKTFQKKPVLNKKLKKAPFRKT
ncbi:hypothetical protein RFI_05691 [Reticulomyxa filosa]|uniref:Uncharacterized protein n=1 Tax=Reticulomyxa filosa TaxID=46433 RepID=X6NYQ0_RETFI|nr:hypothetical protein RFI_05691 [Reticulomyxa filosa]|eukprot:ETO31425.1 hypothetical protein RFI_05691 [Reticulomyxa filosa]